MFNIREYRERDLADCTLCFKEGFFNCDATDNDMKFLTDYAELLINSNDFSYVAEADDRVVGFICGTYGNDYNSDVAGMLRDRSSYGLSEAFTNIFNTFYERLKVRKGFGLGDCDCELESLSSLKDYRKGIGTVLVDRFIERCREDNIKSIRLYTNTTASYKFYERYGFSLYAEKPYSITNDTGKLFIYEYIID